MARWKQPYRDRHGRDHAAEAGSVAELRALRARLIADPEVESVSPTPRCVDVAEIADVGRCPACGSDRDGSTGGVLRHETCLCGIVHVVLRCTATGCWKTTWTPPRHEGCGDIAWDSEGHSDKLYRQQAKRRWRPLGRSTWR